MADGTVIQFEAASGVDYVKVCTVINAFSFPFFFFFYIFKLYISLKMHLFLLVQTSEKN